MSELATSGSVPGGTGGAAAPVVDADEVCFTWHHTHKLDTQKRVAFPADWRPQDPNCKIMLILWPHPNAGRKHGYIFGMLPERFRELKRDLASGGLGDEETGVLRRAIFHNTLALKLDPAGRLCLPVEMAEAIGLTKEVYFVGGGADFEIWDPATFAKCADAEAPTVTEAMKSIGKRRQL